MTLPSYYCFWCNGVGFVSSLQEKRLCFCNRCNGAGSNKVTAIPCKCPSCNGKGKSNPNKCIMTETKRTPNKITNTKTKNCRVCSGSGVIWSTT